MPVTTSNHDSDFVARIPLLQSASHGGPVAFLSYLRSQGGVARGVGRPRLVDFLEDACEPDRYTDEHADTDVASGSDDDRRMEEPEPLEPMYPGPCLSGPSTCSYLTVGQSFVGSQRLSTHSSRPSEDWQVVVRIQGLDMDKGTVCGVMEAQNVPQARTPIVTFWEGEIVDNNNFTFLTQKWGANRDTDMKHWVKFAGFLDLENDVERHSGKAPTLSSSPCIFMRWKETFFVNTSESCGLTIAGFYYICLDRQSGATTGYYYDPNSAPFQFLALKPQSSSGGAAFGSIQMM